MSICRISTEHLEDLVRGGILAPEQASAVRALPPQERRWMGVGAEILLYVGLMIAFGASAPMCADVWNDLPAGGRAALLSVTAAVLLVIGAAIPASSPAMQRLRSVAWLFSTIAVTTLTYGTAEDLWGTSIDAAGVIAATAGALYGAALWSVRATALQQGAVFVSAVAAVTSAMAIPDSGPDATLIAATAALLGAGWLVAGWHGVVQPSTTAEALGSVTMLIGLCFMAADNTAVGLPAGIVASAVLVGYGAREHRIAITGFAVVGLFTFIPWAIGEWLATSLLTSALVVAAGVAVASTGLTLLYRQRRDTTHHPAETA